MFKNYVVTAFRHLIRHPLYSAINIFGFAVGLACCIVILAYVRGELSYDNFVPDHERVYRVAGIIHSQPEERLPVIMGPAGPALAEEIPGIESFTRFRRDNDSVKRGDALFYETVLYTDGSFFNTIALPLVAGDPSTALREPNTVVISESVAKKYFADADPMGQVMLFDGEKPMTVTGVLKDLPENTHLKIGFLSNYRSASYSLGLEDLEQDWGSSNHFTYLKLKPGVRVADIEAQLPAFENRHIPDADLPTGRMKGGDFLDLRLQPFADIHLHSAFLNEGSELKPPGDIALVYAFSGVAALILLIASLNFVVLTTARSVDRAKEVGMRKVLGSTRRALILQFLLETLIVALVAFVIALSLSELLTPVLRELLEAPFTAGATADPGFLAAEIMVIAAVGLAAGAYPALVLSALKPADALKGRMRLKGGRIRTALVMVQFAISIALVIVASVMFAQTSYMRDTRPGYDAKDVVVLRGFWREEAKDALPAVKARLKGEASIESVAAQHAAPGDMNFENRTFRRPAAGSQRIAIATTAVDFGFFELYRVNLVAGRLFSEDRAADLSVTPPEGGETSANAVITRSAVRLLGFDTPDAALGQQVDKIYTDSRQADTGQVLHYTIVGVVDDFQMHDARFEKAPTIFFVEPAEFWSLSVRAHPGQIAAATKAAEEAWRSVLPNLPPRAVNLEEYFTTTFARDARKGAVFAAFAGLGLAIACLGLFGLAAFTVDRRTKEIGIRKVLGASTLRIVGLLVWQFWRPVLVANIIAWPVAWFYLDGWLSGFADRIELNPAYFIAAGLGSLVIAWLTVTAHAVRVARAKPVRALRYE